MAIADSERQIICDGAFGDTKEPGPGPAMPGMGCDMAGGSSGGPFLLGYRRLGGQVNSVVSGAPRDEPEAIYGPYFDDRFTTLLEYAEERA